MRLYHGIYKYLTTNMNIKAYRPAVLLSENKNVNGKYVSMEMWMKNVEAEAEK